MARGLPGVWSTVFSIPFFTSGALLYFSESPYPDLLAVPLFLFAIFILAMGWYIHVLATPDVPSLRTGEEIIDRRYPTQKPAIAKILLGLPFLLVTGYVMLYTTIPYVYPTITFVIGLYLFSTGVLTYWTNSLTTYYITNQRVISEFRLLSLIRKELPIDKIRAVKESKSPIEALVGVGNIHVSSGGGSGLEIVVRNVDNSTGFAESLRQLL